MDNITSGYLSKRGPLIWSKRFFVLQDQKPIEIERLRLVYEKNLKKPKSSSSPPTSSQDFAALNADLFRSISTATISAHPFLAYYKSNSPQDLLTPLGLIDLRNLEHVQVVCRKITKDYVLSLKTNSRLHLLAAPNVSVAKAWETSINERRALIEGDKENVEESLAFKEVYEKLVQKTAFPKTGSQPTSDAILAAIASDAEPMTDSEYEPVVTTTKPKESKPIEETQVVAETERVVEEVVETKVVEEVSVETEIKVVEEVSVEEVKVVEEVVVETEIRVMEEVSEIKAVEEVSVETDIQVVEEPVVETETQIVKEVSVDTETKVVSVETEVKVIDEVSEPQIVKEVSIETETKAVVESPVETVEPVVADETGTESIVPEPTPRKSKRKSFLITALASIKKGKPETTKIVAEPTVEVIVPEVTENAENFKEEKLLDQNSADGPKPEPTVQSPLSEVKKAFNSFFYPKKKEPVTEPVTPDIAKEEEHETVEEPKPSKDSEIAPVVEEAAATETASNEDEKKEEIVAKRKRSIFLQLFRQKKVIAVTETEGAGLLEEKEVEETAAVVATDAPVTEEVKVEITPVEESVVEETKESVQGESKKEEVEPAVEVAKPVASPLVRAFSKLFKVPRKSSVSEPAVTETCKETETPIVEAPNEAETTAADGVETEAEEVTQVVKAEVSATDELATADVPSAAKKRLSMMERFNLFIGKPHPTEIPAAMKEDSNVTVVE